MHIKGEGLGGNPSRLQVAAAGVNCPVSSVDAESLTCVVDAVPTGIEPLRVGPSATPVWRGEFGALFQAWYDPRLSSSFSSLETM